MGMAASQVRFLTLQDRKSTIGMRLGVLSNRKMALTRDMNKAAQAYNEAYSETKLQWYDSINGKYTDISYAAMMTPNAGNAYTPYLLTDRRTGRVILDGASKVSEDVLGYGVSQNDDHWTSHAVFVPTAAAGTMPYHMERLTHVTGDNYIPGTVTYNEDVMAPYIIEQIMGVPGFDRDKMIYEGVKNKEITAGGYQNLVHSDIMTMFTSTVAENARETTTSLVPVWEFRNDQSGNYYTYHRAMDISTGEYIDIAIDKDGNTFTNGLNNTQWWAQALTAVGTLGWSLISYAVDNQPEADTNEEKLLAARNKQTYLDSSGNVHSLTDKIYWSTLYNDNAVVFLKKNLDITKDSDTSPYYSINYGDSVEAICGPENNGWGAFSQSLYDWAYGFADAANKSGLFRYEMNNYLSYIAEATATTLRDAWSGDYNTHKNKNIANVDTYLDNMISSDFEDFKDKFSNNGNVTYNNFKTEVADDLEYSVYASDGNSAVGEGIENGSNNIVVAAAKEANETISPIIIEAAHFQVTNDKTKWIDASGWPGSDSSVAFSVKNMMDVALYYIDIVQDKLKASNGAPNTITEPWDLYQNKYYDMLEYADGNNRNYTEPSNFSQGEIEVFQQGETKVASVRSILSNLEMLKEKVDHCRTDLGITSIPALGNYNVNDQGEETGCDGIYGKLKHILRDIIKNHTPITDERLIELANVNEWICRALEQPYSADPNDSGIAEMLNCIANLEAAESLYEYTDSNQNVVRGYSQDGWGAGQSGVNNNGYAYDGPNNTGTTTWNRREQLFSQDSIDRKATKKLDIEGQLNTLQLHQFKFYVNLVKECLARGWSNHNTSTTSLDNNSVSLHLQNGTWLINDTMAKSSSRVFEVTNKEAREEALSKYEALQTELKVKEERIDIQMEKLETEQNAIKTELDSLKSIIKENIDSTFKIFNA